MSVVDDLKAARELISDPKRWTTGWYARTSDGHEVPVTDPDATCFCALGAIRRVCDNEARRVKHVEDVIERILPADNGWVGYINDRYGHTAVLDLLDRAIEEASRDPA